MPKLHVRYFLFLLLASLSWLNLKSQNVDLVLQVGDQLFEEKQYFGSIQFYEKAMNIDSANAEVLYKYARNLAKINSHAKASRYYLKAYLIDRGKEYPFLAYELAESYRSSGDYRKAKRYYNQALRPYRGDRESYWYKKIAQNKESADWAYKNDSKKSAFPSNLGKVVNTNFSEFASTQNENYFFFSAMIADSLGKNFKVSDDDFFSRIYVKSLNNSKKARPLQFDPQSERYLQGKHLANPAVFENDIYLSICDTTFQCEIWKAALHKDKASNLKKLNNNINDPAANNTQPYLTKIENQTYLFFVSNREKGIGGLDIWYAKRESFGFDEPLNLGTTINSLDDELSPFYDAENQTLYFSSNWHLGFGGFDIFKSKGKPITFKEVENLGYGINSSSNDFYFHPNGSIATFTSNRMENNVESSRSCCNDLFEVAYNTNPKKQKDTLESVQIVNVEVLNKYLPVDLYFHNDQPNPNSRDTVTTADYASLANSYKQRKSEYLSKYLEIIDEKKVEEVESELNDFFEETLSQGLEELYEFTPLLLRELNKGSNIELTIKGFASSVSESDYNLNLTKRRISSLVNYFKKYENGKLVPYLNKSAENGGSLKINQIPYGEYAFKQEIEEDDKVTAVYSPKAIRERKIELVAVSTSYTNSRINIEDQANVSFNSTAYELGTVKQGDIIKRFFNAKNTGNSLLKIYNISSNCECVSLEYSNEIKKGETGKILVSVETEKLKGDALIELTVVTNTINNLNELRLNFSVQP